MSIPVIGGGASWGNNGAGNEENSMVGQDLSSQLMRVLLTVHFTRQNDSLRVISTWMETRLSVCKRIGKFGSPTPPLFVFWGEALRYDTKQMPARKLLTVHDPLFYSMKAQSGRVCQSGAPRVGYEKRKKTHPLPVLVLIPPLELFLEFRHNIWRLGCQFWESNRGCSGPVYMELGDHR